MDWPNWAGETVVVVATGPSAANVPLEIGKGRARFLAVKDAWTLCPWADVLYSCDHIWWDAHKGVPEFAGARIAYDRRTVQAFDQIGFLRVDIVKHQERLLFDRVGCVGWGGNSGFHAINLAAQFGAKRIILVGFDMRVDMGEHFFGNHPFPGGPTKANCRSWARIIDRSASALAELGIDVVNCSPVSAITAFRKMDFEASLALEGSRP